MSTGLIALQAGVLPEVIIETQFMIVAGMSPLLVMATLMSSGLMPMTQKEILEAQIHIPTSLLTGQGLLLIS